jgi:asparagine synthase (glutamine-hydrolysing)
LCFLKPPAVRTLVGKDPRAPLEANPAYGEVTSVYRSCASPDALQRAQYADLKVYMPNDPLVKVDRMSMLHSLEVRSPLLDRRVVEFAFRLPASRKMPRLASKHLLRRLAARRLPPRISTLPKRGFTAPIGSWLRGVGDARFSDEVFGSDSTVMSLLDLRVLRGMRDAHHRQQADHSYTLWAVWMLERWARTRRIAAACATR